MPKSFETTNHKSMHPWKMKVPPLSGEVVERGRRPPYIFYQETNKMYWVSPPSLMSSLQPLCGKPLNHHITISSPSSAPIQYNISVAANSDTTVVSNTQQSQLLTVDSEGDGLSILQVKLSWSSLTENGLNWHIDMECGRNGDGDPGSSRNSLRPSNLKY